MVTGTTIVIGPLPRLLGDLVARVVGTERVHHVAHASTTDALVDAATISGARHVIVALGTPATMRSASCALGTDGPALIGLAGDGRSAERWENGACVRRVDDLSLANLRDELLAEQ